MSLAEIVCLKKTLSTSLSVPDSQLIQRRIFQGRVAREDHTAVHGSKVTIVSSEQEDGICAVIWATLPKVEQSVEATTWSQRFEVESCPSTPRAQGIILADPFHVGNLIILINPSKSEQVSVLRDDCRDTACELSKCTFWHFAPFVGSDIMSFTGSYSVPF